MRKIVAKIWVPEFFIELEVNDNFDSSDKETIQKVLKNAIPQWEVTITNWESENVQVPVAGFSLTQEQAGLGTSEDDE